MARTFSSVKWDTTQSWVDSYARVAGCMGPTHLFPWLTPLGYGMTPALRADLVFKQRRRRSEMMKQPFAAILTFVYCSHTLYT
jgi:hypothetical protein